MGRSRGGLTTKIHALVDAEGRPVRMELTAGQAADAPVAERLLSDLQPGATLLADKAYDTDAVRAFAKSRKSWANIPAKSNRKQTFSFSRWVYRQRNLIERFFNRIKYMRGLATRYVLCALIAPGSNRRWMKVQWQVTATTTPSQKRSTVFTRPRSFIAVDHGGASKRSSSPHWNGWTGSITDDFSSQSGIYRQPKLKSGITPCWTKQPWPHNLNEMVALEECCFRCGGA